MYLDRVLMDRRPMPFRLARSRIGRSPPIFSAVPKVSFCTCISLNNLIDEFSPAAGYKAVVLTVDAPMFGRRLDDLRNGFSVPPGFSFPNLSAQTQSGSGGLGGGIPDLSFGM